MYKARTECRRGEEVQGERVMESVSTDHGVIDRPTRTKNRQHGTSLADARLVAHSGYGHCCAHRVPESKCASVTLPTAINNNLSTSTSHWLLQMYSSMKAYVDEKLLPCERGFCALGAKMELELWEDIIYWAKQEQEVDEDVDIVKDFLFTGGRPRSGLEPMRPKVGIGCVGVTLV